MASKELSEHLGKQYHLMPQGGLRLGGQESDTVPMWQSPLLGFDPMDVSWLLAKSVPAALGERKYQCISASWAHSLPRAQQHLTVTQPRLLGHLGKRTVLIL